jgi:hypothetical protein
MALLANHRRGGRDKSSSAAATAQDPRPVPCHGRQLALWLVPTSGEQALHLVCLLQPLPEQARVAATADNGNAPLFLHQSQRNCDHGSPTSSRIQSTTNASSSCDRAPPAPPQQAYEQSTTTTATTDDNGHDGMTQDSLAQAFTQPPEETNDLSPAHAASETVVDAGVTADPVRPQLQRLHRLLEPTPLQLTIQRRPPRR